MLQNRNRTEKSFNAVSHIMQAMYCKSGLKEVKQLQYELLLLPPSFLLPRETEEK